MSRLLATHHRSSSMRGDCLGSPEYTLSVAIAASRKDVEASCQLSGLPSVRGLRPLRESQGSGNHDDEAREFHCLNSTFYLAQGSLTRGKGPGRAGREAGSG